MNGCQLTQQLRKSLILNRHTKSCKNNPFTYRIPQKLINVPRDLGMDRLDQQFVYDTVRSLSRSLPHALQPDEHPPPLWQKIANVISEQYKTDLLWTRRYQAHLGVGFHTENNDNKIMYYPKYCGFQSALPTQL